MRKKLKKLSNLEYFSHRVDWCKQRYKYISSGSARKVFHYSDTLVIKIAYNDKGIAQNMAECDIWKYAYPNQRKVLAAIVDSCPHNTWVLQKKVTKKIKSFSKAAKEQLKKHSTVLKSLEELDLHCGDNYKSLATSSKGVVLYDYGFTNYVFKQHYSRR
jgi:predicted transcriptional regulator